MLSLEIKKHCGGVILAAMLIVGWMRFVSAAVPQEKEVR